MSDRTVAVGVFVLAVLLVAAGCAPSAYRQHATAITILASAHAAVGATVDAARDAALDEVEAEHPVTGPERTAALGTEAARWTPAGAALDALRAALAAWVEALRMAQQADAGGSTLLVLLLPLARRAVGLYGTLARLLRSLGVDAPELPGPVASLVGGGS